MNYPAVDFRKPVRVPEDVGRMLSQWQQAAREAIEIRFGHCSATGLKILVEPAEPITGAELREETGTLLVYRVDVGEKAEPSLLIVERPLLLALVTETLGAAQEELPEDRPLTNIEQTTADFLMQELRACLDTNQPLEKRWSLKFQGLTNLKELHLEFPVGMYNVSAGYRVEFPYGGGLIRWIIPQNLSLAMVADFPTGFQSNSQATDDLKKSVLHSPAELSVRLGECRMPLDKLQALAPGDVIVLNQRIDEPLQAKLGGQVMFAGWSARNGKYQVYQIDEVVMPQEGN